MLARPRLLIVDELGYLPMPASTCCSSWSRGGTSAAACSSHPTSRSASVGDDVAATAILDGCIQPGADHPRRELPAVGTVPGREGAPGAGRVNATVWKGKAQGSAGYALPPPCGGLPLPNRMKYTAKACSQCRLHLQFRCRISRISRRTQVPCENPGHFRCTSSSASARFSALSPAGL